MIRRFAILSFALAIALGALVAGCSDDSTGPGDTTPALSDFSGNWALSGQVIARRVCDNEVDDTRAWPAVITQDGSSATLSIDGGPPIELTVAGSSATGSQTDGEQLEIAFTIAGGEISGTLTVSNEEPACSEVWSVDGVRTNAAPSPAFAGSWDIDLEVTATTCGGNTGEIEELCLTIEVDGNTVSILEEDGVILGVGDGDTATLSRERENGYLEVTITVSGDELSGTATDYDANDECEVTFSVAGTRRASPCPPPAEPGDFAGNWDMLIGVVDSGCEDEQPGNSFGTCMLATVDGTSITLDDYSQEGLITGTIDGNTAELSRTTDSGELRVLLGLDGDGFVGAASMEYSSGDCMGATVVYSVNGVRSNQACGEGDGPFTGSWDLEGEFTTNECEENLELDCVDFFQNGGILTIDGDQTYLGRLEGNTLTIHTEDTDGTAVFALDIVLELAIDGNSFAATQTLSQTDPENPEGDCVSSVSITGTRTGSCSAPTRSRLVGRGLFSSR